MKRETICVTVPSSVLMALLHRFVPFSFFLSFLIFFSDSELKFPYAVIVLLHF